MNDATIKYSGKSKDKESGEITEFSGEVVAQLPVTVEEAVSAYGEAVCLSKIVSAVTIDIQRVCRVSDGDDAKAQEAVNSFVPGVSRGRSSGGISQKAILAKLKDLSPEKLAELLAGLPAAATE